MSTRRCDAHMEPMSLIAVVTYSLLLASGLICIPVAWRQLAIRLSASQLRRIVAFSMLAAASAGPRGTSRILREC
jgi:hypothetical protein